MQARSCASSGLDSCYVRPIAFLGYGEIGLNPLPCQVNVSIAVWPWGAYLGEESLDDGVRVKVSSWRRMDPNVNPVAAKGTGIYINSSLAKVEAVKSGYDEAILLNTQGFVAECTGENLFIVTRRRARHAARFASGALAGITRDSIMTIARDLGYDVREEQLLRHDLYLADEAFLTGTAAEVVPDPLGRRPRDRRSRRDDPQAPGDLPRHRPRPGRPSTRNGSSMPANDRSDRRSDPSTGAGRDLRHDAARRESARRHLADRRRQVPHRRAARLARRRLHRGGLAGRQPEGRRDVPARAAGARSSTTSTLVAFGSTRQVKGKVDSDDTLRHLARGRHLDRVHRREVVGLPRGRGAADHARRGCRDGRRLGRVPARRRARGVLRRRALLRRLPPQSRVQPARARGRGRRRARPGSCSATRTAARCRTRWSRRSPRSSTTSAATSAIAVHLHDDAGTGVANALAGVRGGAIQVQGTINGYGERTGNCNLTTIIPNLTLKMGIATIPADRLERLTPGRAPRRRAREHGAQPAGRVRRRRRRSRTRPGCT